MNIFSLLLMLGQIMGVGVSKKVQYVMIVLGVGMLMREWGEGRYGLLRARL